MRNLRLLLLSVLYFLFSGSGVFAQAKQGANWLFGEKFHVDFNPQNR
jgi:hypothetical protein